MATTCSFWNFKRWLNECIGTEYKLSDLAEKYQKNPESRQRASDSLDPKKYKEILASLRAGLRPRGISVLTDFFSPATKAGDISVTGFAFFEKATLNRDDLEKNWLKNILALVNRDYLGMIVSQLRTASEEEDLCKKSDDDLRQEAENLMTSSDPKDNVIEWRSRLWLIQILSLLNRDALVRIVSFWVAQWGKQQNNTDSKKSARKIKRCIKIIGDTDLRQVAAALISANDAEKKGKTNQEFIQEFIDKIKTTSDWFKKLEEKCQNEDDSDDSIYKKIKNIRDSEDKGSNNQISKSAEFLIILFEEDPGWWQKCDPDRLDRIRQAIEAYIKSQESGSSDEFIKAVNTLDALKKVYTGKLKGNESYKSYLPGDSKVTSPDDSKVTSPDDPKANSSDDSQKELNPIREIFKKNTTTCGNAGKAIIEDHPAICEIFNKNIRGEIKKQAYRWRWVAAVVMLLVIMLAGLIGINYWFNREIKIATKGIAVERYKEGLIVTGYYEGVAQSEQSHLIIPPNFSIEERKEGKKIVAIAAEAFKDCKNLVSVEIRASITTIGENAFAGCTSLTSVQIPDSVKTIGESAFADCPITKATIPTSAIKAIPKNKLQTVVLTSGEEIRAGAFKDCKNLSSVVIPDTVETIEKGAFDGCPITRATIPTSAIEAIPKEKLQTVVLTSGAKISAGAFKDCTSLASVTIPDSVKTIGENAFAGCGSLTKACIDLEGWCTTTKEGKEICWDESAIEASPEDHANKLREYTSEWQKNAD